MVIKLKAIVAFLYDFVVGDDWRVAVAVVATLAITYGVATSVPAWWVTPVIVALLLPFSVWRSTKS